MTVYNSIEEAVKDTNAAINEIAKLQAENAQLQAEVKLQSDSADHWEDEAMNHMSRAAQLQAENAKLQAEVELQSDSADH